MAISQYGYEIGSGLNRAARDADRRAKAQQIVQQRRSGLMSPPPSAQKYAGANPAQNQLINQNIQQETKLNNFASSQLPKINENLSSDFNWGGLPSAPVTGDYNKWRQQQIDSTYNDFASRNEPLFQQQQEHTRAQLSNEGIPEGSELYNRRMQELQRNQNDARQSAQALAMQQAQSAAQGFFNIGTQARSNALGEKLQQRYMPAQEYGMLKGLQGGYGQNALEFSQGKETAADAFERAKYLQAHQPTEWQQAGFPSYDAYAQYNLGLDTQRAANAANLQRSLQPSPWASGVGNIGGAALQGALGSEGFWNWIAK